MSELELNTRLVPPPSAMVRDAHVPKQASAVPVMLTFSRFVPVGILIVSPGVAASTAAGDREEGAARKAGRWPLDSHANAIQRLGERFMAESPLRRCLRQCFLAHARFGVLGAPDALLLAPQAPLYLELYLCQEPSQ